MLWYITCVMLCTSVIQHMLYNIRYVIQHMLNVILYNTLCYMT